MGSREGLIRRVWRIITGAPEPEEKALEKVRVAQQEELENLEKTITELRQHLDNGD